MTQIRVSDIMLRVFFIFGFFHAVMPLAAQVNTENMRRFNAKTGFAHSISFQLGYVSGNSDVSNFSTGYRVDWLTENYYSFAVANYQRGESRGKLNVRKGFVHVRVSRNITDVWIVEAFGQKEFNDFWRLADRQLGGSGLRYELAGRDSANRVRSVIAAGSGLMREYEKLKKPLDQTITQWRSTSYVSVIVALSKGVDLSSTAYAQIGLRRPSDYRLLNESRLSVQLWKNLSFGTTFRFRYDHEPPTGVEKRDIELTNGIAISF